MDTAWSGTDSFQVLGPVYYSMPHDLPVNDPYFNQQDYMLGYEGSQNVLPAWPFTKGDPAVKVCVIDDGVDVTHDDLWGRWTAGYHAKKNQEGIAEFRDALHGTPVTGLIAAFDSNGIGVAGINWHSQLYVAMAVDEPPLSGDIWYPDPLVGRAVDWATRKNVDVISMSFGHIDDFYQSVGRSLFWKNKLAAALNNAWQKGALLVASKGNEASTEFNLPSDLPTVMGIGACDASGNRTSFSNCGASLDILAGGDYGYTTSSGNSYDYFSGTSMAAPVASGVASLVKSVNPDLTADEIEQIMEITALNAEGPGWHSGTGWGILKADSAVAFAASNVFLRKEAIGGSRQLFQGAHEHTFSNNGGLATGSYFGVETYRVTQHFNYSEYGFTEMPTILIRHRGSKGWSAANPSVEFPWSRVVPGSVTLTGCDVETFAFFIRANLQGQTMNDWYPCDGEECGSGSDIKFKITIAGHPRAFAPASLQGFAGVLEYPDRQAVRLSWPDALTHSKPAG